MMSIFGKKSGETKFGKTIAAVGIAAALNGGAKSNIETGKQYLEGRRKEHVANSERASNKRNSAPTSYNK